MRGSAYNWVEQLLHWLALEPRAVRELSFELDCSYALDDGATAEGSVYVCGLARSGTTILLRALARLDAFRSLTYRDMPFVLAPNLWRRVTANAARRAAPGERAHGDGIIVDFDSPEAFEEVFWRTFGEKPDALERFARYRALVARPRGQPARRYLSKNNNNVMRLGAIASDPTSVTFIVYRDPVACARSLYRQHLRFCAAQEASPFTRRYMRWLGHHEFGLEHEPYDFAAPAMDPALAPSQPDYWLDYWNAVHTALPSLATSNMHFVEHDRFCERPVPAMARILDIAGIEADVPAICAEVRPASWEDEPAEFTTSLVTRARKTMERMTMLTNNIQ